ncbi:MAG: hypothetical protein JW913_05335 [Chitinispirillaceae bacterium]|nr:hypothetical protein [Chitinispirillaceae bacterium]
MKSKGAGGGCFTVLSSFSYSSTRAPVFFLVFAISASLYVSGCMRYLTHDRSKVILLNVDIDQTLDIAVIDLDRGTRVPVLTVWAVRDQVVTPAEATRVSDLYFSHIDKIKGKFNVWHLTWAIADLYRNGNPAVKASLDSAYGDARIRVRKSYGIADRFVNGDKLYMGDAHLLGRAYAHRHVVVPGNPDYMQSAAEYRKKNDAKK